jgi:uncharacterized protein (DUF4213/DUF364 family)
MNDQSNKGILETSKVKLNQIAQQDNLLELEVSVKVKALTAQEAIGQPQRQDFPIIEGKEVIIEADILGSKGHSFTDSPMPFRGRLEEILNLPLTTNANRALYVASLNALIRHLYPEEKTLHCRDDEPEKCGKEIASHILKTWGMVRVGQIGLNPAIAEALVETFGSQNVKITDLNNQNIGQLKYDVMIWDAREMTEPLIEQSDVVLLTGTTLVNGTFDDIMNSIINHTKDYLIYGVTCAGVCKLIQLNRICPYARIC